MLVEVVAFTEDAGGLPPGRVTPGAVPIEPPTCSADIEQMTRDLARLRDRHIAPEDRAPGERRKRGTEALQHMCLTSDAGEVGSEPAWGAMVAILGYFDRLDEIDREQLLADLDLLARAYGVQTGLVQVYALIARRMIARAAEVDKLELLLDTMATLELLTRLVSALWPRQLKTSAALRRLVLVDLALATPATESSSGAQLLGDPWDHPPPVRLGPTAQPIAPHAPPARGSRWGHEMARRVLGGVPMSED